jgi:ABC-type transport system involved in cytochrome bd biosynthesis fused ATPase/permease subunit
MAGNTVAELNNSLTSFIDELTVLTASIKDSYNSSIRGPGKVGSQDLSMKKDIREFKQKADSYDRQFEEEESRLQAFGGKTRKQTLQEFIILFFFLAYGFMTVAFLLYANRVGLDTAKILAAMVFILLVLTAIIITYA